MNKFKPIQWLDHDPAEKIVDILKLYPPKDMTVLKAAKKMLADERTSRDVKTSAKITLIYVPSSKRLLDLTVNDRNIIFKKVSKTHSKSVAIRVASSLASFIRYVMLNELPGRVPDNVQMSDPSENGFKLTFSKAKLEDIFAVQFDITPKGRFWHIRNEVSTMTKTLEPGEVGIIESKGRIDTKEVKSIIQAVRSTFYKSKLPWVIKYSVHKGIFAVMRKSDLKSLERGES